MKRSAIAKLSDPVWITPIPGDPLEVAIVPAYAHEISSLIVDPGDDRTIRRVCTRCFTDFRNYYEVDGETPIRNNLDDRMSLFYSLHVRRGIISNASALNDKISEGEESAA